VGSLLFGVTLTPATAGADCAFHYISYGLRHQATFVNYCNWRCHLDVLSTSLLVTAVAIGPRPAYRFRWAEASCSLRNVMRHTTTAGTAKSFRPAGTGQCYYAPASRCRTAPVHGQQRLARLALDAIHQYHSTLQGWAIHWSAPFHHTQQHWLQHRANQEEIWLFGFTRETLITSANGRKATYPRAYTTIPYCA
jgi:hypothetical protein